MASERNFSVKPYINLREKLAQNFSAHPQVGLYLRHHTAVIDKFVKDCAAFAKVPPTCAIAALGGYGRREMFPYSDIDVAVPPKASRKPIRPPLRSSSPCSGAWD